MAATVCSPVHLSVRLGGSEPVCADIGTITVALKDDLVHLDMDDLRHELGDLLVQAGQYMLRAT